MATVIFPTQAQVTLTTPSLVYETMNTFFGFVHFGGGKKRQEKEN